MKSRRRPLVLFAGVLPLLAGSSAFADAVSYSKVVDLRAESAAVVAEHHHDWSKATQDARWKMISTTKDPFTAENTYAYLRLVDRPFPQPLGYRSAADVWRRQLRDQLGAHLRLAAAADGADALARRGVECAVDGERGLQRLHQEGRQLGDGEQVGFHGRAAQVV